MLGNKEEIITEREIKNKTILSFIIFFLLIAAAIIGWKWLNKQPHDNGIPVPLRAVINKNESFFSRIVFDENNLSKIYPAAVAEPRVRVNGDIGTGEDFDASKWKLQVVRNAGDTLFISLADIKALPKTEIVFDFKCIEGWSQVTHWGGVKFSDFVKRFKLFDEAALQYTGLITPDKKYYVGIDQQSIMQQQTILCYEMNGKPLPMNQGYPLRLIIPVKYGIKHLKRIGTISFSNQRPADYWFERGYDYYTGL